jgi:hypothetical protein
MRWRIPLITALALFVAVSCDRQPVEPSSDNADEALFTVENYPTESGEYTWTWKDYDACGIDVVSGDLTCKWNYKWSKTNDEMIHFHYKENCHGWMTGESGNIWRANETWSNESNFIPPSDVHDQTNFWVMTNWISHGSQPNLTTRWKRIWVVANGEERVDIGDFGSPVMQCPE